MYLVYQRAIDAGALGGKLLGAGGSGFMLFFVPLVDQEYVKAALPEYLHVPVKFEKDGCSVIHYNVDPQDVRRGEGDAKNMGLLTTPRRHATQEIHISKVQL